MIESFNPVEKHRANLEEQESLQRALGNIGFYTCQFDEYPTVEHPLDNQWIVLGED